MNVDEALVSRRRLAISAAVLTIFFAAVLAEYWPDLAIAVMRVANSARSVGADKVESRYFDVVNRSNAGTGQVRGVISKLEGQVEAILEHTQAAPPAEPIPVLLSNGTGPALTDGSQIMLSYAGGRVNVDLAPMFLVWIIEGIPVNPQDGLVPAGGYALRVVEASGLGDEMIRQPLDHWVLLLHERKVYMPLEEAWVLVMPSDEAGAYNLMRGLLEAGSFMSWLDKTYGEETAGLLARGETIETLTGKTLAEIEAEWLRSLEAQAINPKSCTAAIPQSSLFRLLCRNMDS